MNLDLSLLAAICVSLISGGLAQYLLSVFLDRRKRSIDIKKLISETRKTEAEIESTQVATAMLLVDKLSKRIDELESDIRDERKSRDELEKRFIEEKHQRELLQERVGIMIRGVYALSEQIKQTGREPVFIVPDKFK